ncbi:phosphotransferase [Pseudomonas sp. ZT5P21]
MPFEVPMVISRFVGDAPHAESTEGEFMITRCVPGKPIQARSPHQGAVLELFREALLQLQAVPITDCPFDSSASFRLNELEYLFARDLCEKEYDLQQWSNLSTPEELLVRLHSTLPREETVFSHGDLCD